MKKLMHKIAQEIQIREDRAYIRRAMWIDFEDRLEKFFQDLAGDNKLLSHFGNIYLSTTKDFYGSKIANQISRTNLMNYAQISSGTRILGFSHNLKSAKNKSIKLATESEAALCFHQLSDGRVNVYLYPYKSDLVRMDEDFIFLGINLEPNYLTNEIIQSFTEKFFRYCLATSAISTGSYSSYLYRTRLRLLDFRYKKIQKSKLILIVEKILVIALAVLGVWATLLTGGRWPI